MSDIFLSYAHQDRETMRRFLDVFEKKRWSVWWDDKLRGGVKYDQAIEDELSCAKCVVVLVSQYFKGSDATWNEALIGQRRGVLILVLIENIDVPFLFMRSQALKLFDWRGEENHRELQKLFEAVEHFRTKPDAHDPSAKAPVAEDEEPGKVFFLLGRSRRLLFGLAAALLITIGGSLLSFYLFSRQQDETHHNASMNVGPLAQPDLQNAGVKLHFSDARLLDVLHNCAHQVGAVLATGDNLNRSSTVKISVEAPLKQVMDDLCTAYDCTWKLFPGHPPVIFVDSKSNPSPQSAPAAPTTPAPSAGRRR